MLTGTTTLPPLIKLRIRTVISTASRPAKSNTISTGTIKTSVTPIVARSAALVTERRLFKRRNAGKKKIASTADHASGTKNGAVIRKTR